MAFRFLCNRIKSYFLFFLVIFVKSSHVNGNVYGDLMMYLKMYNDIDVQSVLFIDGERETMEFDQLFDYITMEDKELSFEAFFPFSYLEDALENSILRLMNALDRSEKATLVFVNHLVSKGDARGILEHLTEDLLQKHIWLFFHPFSNLTESNFRKQNIITQLDANPNLKLNSQVVFITYIEQFLFMRLDDYSFV